MAAEQAKKDAEAAKIANKKAVELMDATKKAEAARREDEARKAAQKKATEEALKAAELAERALHSSEYTDERRGYDPHGWADGSELFSPPQKHPQGDELRGHVQKANIQHDVRQRFLIKE